MRVKLQADGERIRREIEEYAELSQQGMQITKVISESVEKLRPSLADQRTAAKQTIN